MSKAATVAKVTPLEGGFCWEFANGATETVMYADLPDNSQAYIQMYGLRQKGQDSYASAKGDPAVAHGLFMKAVDALRSGEISVKRAGGPREEPIDILIQAAVTVLGKPEDVVRPAIEAMDREKRNKLRKVGEIAKAIIDIKAAATKQPTLSELLAL